MCNFNALYEAHFAAYLLHNYYLKMLIFFIPLQEFLVQNT